jgi:prephenate dehydratase
MRHDPGIYAFFVDFQGSDKDERVKGVLEAIQKQTTSFKFLGCYEGKDL